MRNDIHRRVQVLEQRTANNVELPLCLFIVAIESGDGDAPRVNGYTAGDRQWTRGARETAKQLRDRVAAEVQGTGRVTLVCAQYEEKAA